MSEANQRAYVTGLRRAQRRGMEAHKKGLPRSHASSAYKRLDFIACFQFGWDMADEVNPTRKPARGR